jgi:hypothetical protein
MPKGSQLKDSGKLGRGMMALPHFLAGGGEIGTLMRAKSRRLGRLRLRLMFLRWLSASALTLASP